MSRQPSANTAPMTPVTPVWADRLHVAQQPPPHGALLPSVFEITPPQTAPRKSAYAVAMSSATASQPPPVAAAHAGSSSLVGPQMSQAGPAPAASATLSLHEYPVHDGLADVSAHAMASMPMPTVSPHYTVPQAPHLTPLNGSTAMSQGMSSSPMMPMMSAMSTQLRSRRMGIRGAAMPTVPLSFVPQPVVPDAHAHPPPAHVPAKIPSGRVNKAPPAAKPRHSSPQASFSPYAVEFQKKYAAYNQYIMRQSLEETEQSKVIWPPDVELAFMEAVWLVPGVQRHKILVDRRHRGRNELIADYVEYKTGQARTRKQVSSHLQVLKKLLKDDEEFLQLLKPRDEPSKSGEEKSGQEMAVKSLAHLVTKMRAAKGSATEPAFLLQAQANYAHSVMKKKQREQAQSQPAPGMSVMQVHEPLQTQPPQVTNASATRYVPPSSAPAFGSTIPATHIHRATNTAPGPGSGPEKNSSSGLADAPLLHPKPVHQHETFAEPAVVPAASVPPEDSIMALVEPPQSQFKRRHRRTASTSIDLGSDRGLPIVFRMARRSSTGVHMYTRLLRACYESPTRPKPLEQLLGKFSELESLQNNGMLSGAQVVHANCLLHLASHTATSTASDYSSDVQFLLSMEGGPWQHRYVVRTVVCSRGQELLRSETPCTFQRIIGRGREQDCEAVNVPFRADFWGDFLNRLEHCEPTYATAAIEALAVTQCVYRVTQAAEELCIVGVYEFGVASDEFSARARFRRVKSTLRNEQEEPNTPTRRVANDVPLTQGSPKRTPPRSANTPTHTGPLGTPSFNLGINLGNVLGYESPALFGSPRRPIQALDVDVSLSPFDFGESRGSPRASSKFEIQRSMTAFEPAAWEDLQDWMFS